MMRSLIIIGTLLFGVNSLREISAAETWPALPEMNGAVEIPAQEWPLRPGPRTVRVLVHYPGGQLSRVNARTALMLTLHNWGGTDCVGTAAPQILAERYNVVAICVNYLQSGPKDSIEGPEPYDFGHLQALDALRALWYIDHGLKERQIPFCAGLCFATGGSGGGNVSLMVRKFAPGLFHCVIDICGMKKLSDDIAFNLPGGSDLNARYSRDPESPNYLSLAEQELRFVAHPAHLVPGKLIVVHGVDDHTCPYADAVEMVEAMRRARIDVTAHFVTRDDLDGQVFTGTGHSLGNRTEIVQRVAGEILAPDNAVREQQHGPTVFDKRETHDLPVTGGRFVIDYAQGYPVSRFVPAPPVVETRPHQRLDSVQLASGEIEPIRTLKDWEIRREQVRRNFERAAGQFPSPLKRVPLDLKVLDETTVGKITRRKVSYQADPDDRVPAYVLLPEIPAGEKRPAVLCLQQTTSSGKDEPAGVRGDASLKYALELAERGYVAIVPDYPSFGEHAYDFAPAHGYQSGTMKAVWDNVRAIDVLETLPEVDATRIGCIGHSLGGHNGIFTALFEPRIQALVTSCGFSSLQRDDVPSWTGPRYMPLIASEFGNDPQRVPFDFHELIAALAPRAVFVSASTQDNDFDVEGVREVIAEAEKIYRLYPDVSPGRLVGHYPEAPHSFPDAARQRAYEFLDQALQFKPRP